MRAHNPRSLNLHALLVLFFTFRPRSGCKFVVWVGGRLDVLSGCGARAVGQSWDAGKQLRWRCFQNVQVARGRNKEPSGYRLAEGSSREY